MTLYKTEFSLLAVLLLAGCSSIMTYRTFDQPRSPDQIAVLWIPINLEPLDVDGQKAGPHFIPVSDRYKIELLPGAHTFVVRYSGLAGGPSSEQEEMINSPPVTVALEAAQGHTYRLTYARADIDRMFAKQLTNITVRVEDITANPAIVKQLNRGWQTCSVIIHEPTRQAASTTAPKPVASPTPTSLTASPSVTQASAPTTASDPAVLEQLKHWWRQADETERGKFLNWTVQQK
ncbi:MAG: DUF2057 domain-containing protein [Verrucomicrobia bacterium]|nr:DUF2057 domain-containing protein [Verrucomicrobiota bacterium]MBU1734987.1 DUF2057 domain-containing protein [Verrucomicrobiota bacterium]MBU1856260.1 DUF2057 domain-containing protein [Verrucomicrobiota bacterium]